MSTTPLGDGPQTIPLQRPTTGQWNNLAELLEIPLTKLPKNNDETKLQLTQQLEKTKDNNHTLKLCFRAVSFLAGAALGALGAVALLGIMSTPVGWGIAAGVLVAALIGSYMCGGMEEFFKSLLIASGGSIMAFGGGLAGTGIAALAAGTAAAGTLFNTAFLALSTFMGLGLTIYGNKSTT